MPKKNSLNKIKDMSNKELQTYIRALTKEANNKLEEINKYPRTRAIDQELQSLKDKGIIGKRGKFVLDFNYREEEEVPFSDITFKVTRRKTKNELIQQARELEYFNQWKGTEVNTPHRNRTDLKKYKAFIRNNPNMSDLSFDEWREMVELFGVMDSTIQSFGYENIKQTYKNTVDKRKHINFIREMERVKRNKPLTKEDAIDMLKAQINQSE